MTGSRQPARAKRGRKSSAPPIRPTVLTPEPDTRVVEADSKAISSTGLTFKLKVSYPPSYVRDNAVGSCASSRSRLVLALGLDPVSARLSRF